MLAFGESNLVFPNIFGIVYVHSSLFYLCYPRYSHNIATFL